jgi:hypothetical protein
LRGGADVSGPCPGFNKRRCDRQAGARASRQAIVERPPSVASVWIDASATSRSDEVEPAGQIGLDLHDAEWDVAVVGNREGKGDAIPHLRLARTDGIGHRHADLARVALRDVVLSSEGRLDQIES